MKGSSPGAAEAFGPYEAWISLKLAISNIERHALEKLKPHGLTVRQMELLLAVTDDETRLGCPLSLLAERLGVSRADMTGVADHLCALKAAERRLRKDDRRLRLLALTPKGLELRRGLRAGYEAVLREGLAVLATQAATSYLWSLSVAPSRRRRQTPGDIT